jgi:hypothetical protein
MRAIRSFGHPETVEEFTKMVRLLLDDAFSDIGMVDPHGDGAVKIEWSYDVPDDMPAVIIRIADYEAEIAARVEEQDREGDWERQPRLS